jgi:hypothetical protein
MDEQAGFPGIAKQTDHFGVSRVAGNDDTVALVAVAGDDLLDGFDFWASAIDDGVPAVKVFCLCFRRDAVGADKKGPRRRIVVVYV